MRLSTAVLCSVPLLALSACDDKYLVGYGPDAAPPAGGTTGGSGSGGAGTGTGGSSGASGLGGAGTGGSSGASGLGGAGPGGGSGAGGAGGSGAGGGGSGGGLGGSGGGLGSAGGTGGIPGPPAMVPDACGVVPAPMPLAAVSLSPAHMAERLARFLWAGRTDEDLLARAAALRDTRDLFQLADQMLRDPRAEAAVRGLMRRWLRLDQLVQPSPPDPLWPAAVSETDMFVTRVVLFEDARLATLLTAPFTFVDDARLAALYGAAPPAHGTVRITPATDQRRSGILTHASVLQAHPRAPGRGTWIRDAFLCQAIPPPPFFTGLQPATGPGSTARQRLEGATREAVCSGCHLLIDPPGFALERFDETGRRRDLDNGAPIDDTGTITLPNGGATLTFQGAQQLGQLLAASCEVKACAVQALLGQALAGPLTAADRASEQQLAAAFALSGYNLRELLIAITGSKSFLSP
jgi:hypothetical protein